MGSAGQRTAGPLDHWAGDTPAEISRLRAITGTPPMMPDYAMGFWQ